MTAAQRLASGYQQRGFAIVRRVLDTATLTLARDEATAICRGDRGIVAGVTPAAPDQDDVAAISRYLGIHFPQAVEALPRSRPSPGGR